MSYNPGQEVTFTVQFKESGVLFDPNSISVVIYDPLNTLITTITETRISTGVYQITYTIPDSSSVEYGLWTHRWTWQALSGMEFTTDSYEFRVVAATVYQDLTVGDSNWVSHNIDDYNENPVIGLDEADVICLYWNRVMQEFQQKQLDSNNFVAAEVGEYKVLYDASEIGQAGPFISLLYPSSDEWIFKPSTVVCTATDTVSGTCSVTGSFIKLNGQALDFPVEIVVENLYNPIVYSIGGVIESEQRYYSDVAGEVSLVLLQGMKVRISIGHFGITGTITIPYTDSADIFDLLAEAEDDFEPR